MSSFAATLVALALSACATSPLWAQTQSVRVPLDQRALSDILSKYNDLAAEAPNDIQRKKIEAQFYQEFCARIPKGDVSGWIGDVGSVDDVAQITASVLMWASIYLIFTVGSLALCYL